MAGNRRGRRLHVQAALHNAGMRFSGLFLYSLLMAGVDGVLRVRGVGSTEPVSDKVLGNTFSVDVLLKC